jgi:hypothetical protein
VIAVEAAAGQEGIGNVAFRCQTVYDWTLRRLVARGYRVRWSDLRMTCVGYPERAPASGVVFSNWEIIIVTRSGTASPDEHAR